MRILVLAFTVAVALSSCGGSPEPQPAEPAPPSAAVRPHLHSRRP